MNPMFGNALGAVGWVALTVGLVVWLRGGRKSALERERERRLAVNAAGRMTEGTLLETARLQNDSTSPPLLFYRYAAAGVEYSAAQDVSALSHLVQLERCWAGTTVTVKYDPHHPSNSILVCELWSGLPDAGRKPRAGAAAPSLPTKA